jgi:hypothetical protein
MKTDSYTTVDRNKLLRRIEVLISAHEEYKRVELEAWKKELREWCAKPWNILTIIMSSKKERLVKKFTEEDFNDRKKLTAAYYVLHNGWNCAKWAWKFDGEKETMALYGQLTAPAETPTILLSTTHIVSIDAYERALTNEGYME